MKQGELSGTPLLFHIFFVGLRAVFPHLIPYLGTLETHRLPPAPTYEYYFKFHVHVFLAPQPDHHCVCVCVHGVHHMSRTTFFTQPPALKKEEEERGKSRLSGYIRLCGDKLGELQ